MCDVLRTSLVALKSGCPEAFDGLRAFLVLVVVIAVEGGGREFRPAAESLLLARKSNQNAL